MIEFSTTEPRCASCGQRTFHWPGCTSKKFTVRPSGADEPAWVDWVRLRLGGRAAA